MGDIHVNAVRVWRLNYLALRLFHQLRQIQDQNEITMNLVVQCYVQDPYEYYTVIKPEIIICLVKSVSELSINNLCDVQFTCP